MIPAFIPFAVFSLSSIVSVFIYPIAISVQILAGERYRFGQDQWFGGYIAAIVLTGKTHEIFHSNNEKPTTIEITFSNRFFFSSFVKYPLGIVTYLTIVEYSLCKSLEEAHRLQSTRMPYTASCPPQTLPR